jgi:hypothetical protein
VVVKDPPTPPPLLLLHRLRLLPTHYLPPSPLPQLPQLKELMVKDPPTPPPLLLLHRLRLLQPHDMPPSPLPQLKEEVVVNKELEIGGLQLWIGRINLVVLRLVWLVSLFLLLEDWHLISLKEKSLRL